MRGARDITMPDATPNIRDDIAAYEAMRSDLEASNLGNWALFHARQLQGVYRTFEEAAQEAVRQFGRGPYLIRQIGAPSVTLPASVVYGPLHAINVMRV